MYVVHISYNKHNPFQHISAISDAVLNEFKLNLLFYLSFCLYNGIGLYILNKSIFTPVAYLSKRSTQYNKYLDKRNIFI